MFLTDPDPRMMEASGSGSRSGPAQIMTDPDHGGSKTYYASYESGSKHFLKNWFYIFVCKMLQPESQNPYPHVIKATLIKSLHVFFCFLLWYSLENAFAVSIKLLTISKNLSRTPLQRRYCTAAIVNETLKLEKRDQWQIKEIPEIVCENFYYLHPAPRQSPSPLQTFCCFHFCDLKSRSGTRV